MAKSAFLDSGSTISFIELSVRVIDKSTYVKLTIAGIDGTTELRTENVLLTYRDGKQRWTQLKTFQVRITGKNKPRIQQTAKKFEPLEDRPN